MKRLYSIPLLCLFVLTLGCTNNEDKEPIDQLPAATQSGAGTAGCLINGEAFLPKGSGLGGPVLSAFYEFSDGGHHFGFGFKNNQQTHLRDVYIYVNNELKNNSIYELKTQVSTNSYGEYAIGGGLVDIFETTAETSGELIITYIDPEQSIISGTFWFDAINEEGETVEIREGRFDVHYAN